VFIEWVGDFPSEVVYGTCSIQVPSTACRRPSNDFRIGAGLNKDAPSFVFGLGYSYRFDQPF
jgi:hypothetical protein